MRTPTVINEDTFKSALETVESNGPLKNRGILYQKVANQYNREKGELKEISAAIVRSRVLEWSLSVKTPLGRRTKSLSVIEEKPDGEVVKKNPNKEGLNVVKIPRGEPLPLTAFDHDSILNWTERMRDVGKKNGEYITKDALQFYVRKNITDDANKAREICDIIRNHVEDEY